MHEVHTEKPMHLMDGIYRGVPKRTTNPIVDGIVTGLPRKAHPSAATPTEAAPGPCATSMPKNSFGSGVFAESANIPKGGHYSAPAAGGRKRPETPPKKEAEVHGTKKGMARKTARRAYEP